jgi:Mor family transcriptional regulator
VARIKGQLSDAYTSLIPDYSEHDALKKNVSALIKDLDRIPKDSISSAWASAINGENTIFELSSIEQELKNYQPPARSRLFSPEEEPQLV